MQTIDVICQVLKSDFTWQDKAKRWQRLLRRSLKNAWDFSRAKAAEWRKAIADFLSNLRSDLEMGLSELVFGGSSGGGLAEIIFGPEEKAAPRSVARDIFQQWQSQGGLVYPEQVQETEGIAAFANQQAELSGRMAEALKNLSESEALIYRHLAYADKAIGRSEATMQRESQARQQFWEKQNSIKAAMGRIRGV